MKRISLFISLMLLSAFVFSQWLPLTSGTTAKLNSICFTNPTTAYVAGSNGTILKTTNAGTNWISLTSGTNFELNSIYFTSENTGYAVGGNGTILKTTNEGNSWFLQTISFPLELQTVKFTDATTGYAGGGGWTSYFKTTNGGTNWIEKPLSHNMTQAYCFYFTNINVGYLVGASFANSNISKTTDAGNSWIGCIQNYDLVVFYSVHFINTNIGCTVGQNIILKTTNGGTNWFQQINGVPISNQLYSVFFTDVSNGYAVGSEGLIIKTTNGGNNWFTISAGTTSGLNSVYFTDANTGYIVGYGGVILKTTNGGWCTGIAGQPTGPATVCATGTSQYTTSGATNATSYIWSITPTTAGTISGSGLTANVTWNGSFSGSAQITVRGHNACGDGPVSSPMNVTVYPLTIGGNLYGGSTICLGASTATLTLSGHRGSINKWQKKLNSGTWSDIANTSTTYSEIPLSVGTWEYRVEVQSGLCASAYSGSTTVIVNALPPTPTITQILSVLTSDAPAGNQWYRNNSIIPGATSQSYTCTQNGDYFDIVTLSGCKSDTSNIITITNVGIEFIENNKTFKVYPNPVTNELIIEIAGSKEETSFEILNSIGQVVFKGKVMEKMMVNTNDYMAGVYIIKFENGKTFEFRKILKE